MQLTIHINRIESGMEIRMSRPACQATDLEDAYSEALVEGITEYLKLAIPVIGKNLGADAAMRLNVKPQNS